MRRRNRLFPTFLRPRRGKLCRRLSLDLGPGSPDVHKKHPFYADLFIGPSLLNYDWSAMKSYRKGAPEGQNAAIVSGKVAPLLHDLGLILKMNYSKNISTAESKRRVFLNLGFNRLSKKYVIEEYLYPSYSPKEVGK